MTLIKNPNELPPNATWAGLIYGEPGTGKSTLALSAPNPVMLDADNGMKRVQKRFQTPSLPMTGYQQVLDLLASNELDPFDTIVPDTLGKFVDFIGDWLIQMDPKNKKKGGGLSQAGYGAIKVEFARVVREFKKKNKYLLFVAHGREEKDSEITKNRPDVAGSSGKDLVKELDFMGYVEMVGERRTISFSPTERFYAKNSLNLPPVIEIPDPDRVGNTFIQKYIIEQSQKRQQIDDEENQKYVALVSNLQTLIAAVKDAKSADEALATILMAPVMWDSQRVAKAHLNELAKMLNLTYDKATKAFVNPPPKVEEKSKAESAPVTTTMITTALPPGDPSVDKEFKPNPKVPEEAKMATFHAKAK